MTIIRCETRRRRQPATGRDASALSALLLLLIPTSIIKFRLPTPHTPHHHHACYSFAPTIHPHRPTPGLLATAMESLLILRSRVMRKTVMCCVCRASAPIIPWLRLALAGPSLIMRSSSSFPEDGYKNRPQHASMQSSQIPTKNIRLEAIKSVGMTQLHNHTQDLISRTRQPLFEDNMLDAHGQQRQSIAQKQESNRLESALISTLAYYSSKHTTFSVRGQCIDVLGVEVSPDLKHARVYWCLPLGIDLRNLPHSKLEAAVKKMQQILDEKGGKIQALVHSRLRSYYPPKIKWVASEHVSKDLKRGVSLESGKKKKWG